MVDTIFKTKNTTPAHFIAVKLFFIKTNGGKYSPCRFLQTNTITFLYGLVYMKHVMLLFCIEFQHQLVPVSAKIIINDEKVNLQ